MWKRLSKKDTSLQIQHQSILDMPFSIIIGSMTKQMIIGMITTLTTIMRKTMMMKKILTLAMLPISTGAGLSLLVVLWSTCLLWPMQ